jgi:hypothetical protein
MLRFRILAVVVGTGFAFGAILARAEDTAAQAAARAALQQQMNQMDNGQGSTNSMTPPEAPSAPPEAPSAPPEAPTAPPATPSAPPPAQPPSVPMPTPQFSTNIPVNPETESKMAPAGMSQTNEPANAQMNAQTKLPSLTVPPPSALMTNETENYPVNPPMAPLPPAQGESPSTVPPSAPMDTQPMTLPSPGPGAPAQPNSGAQQPPPSAPNQTEVNIQNERTETNSVPNYDTSMKAPPLPISQQQQAELQSLLSQYMANQITPAQYQQQRAQILGQQ